jgi:hypothetical protein
MKRVLPAPTGRHAIAQGNALGSWAYTFPSPERATCFYAVPFNSKRNIPPLQGGNSFGPCPQGVALGFHRTPRWGFEPFGGTPIEPSGDNPMNRLLPIPTGHHAIAQGNALGSWAYTFPNPERAAWFYGAMDGSAWNIPPLQGGISYGPFGGTPIEPFGDNPMTRLLPIPTGHHATAILLNHVGQSQ